jgi:hypothetical protein
VNYEELIAPNEGPSMLILTLGTVRYIWARLEGPIRDDLMELLHSPLENDNLVEITETGVRLL